MAGVHLDEPDREVYEGFVAYFDDPTRGELARILYKSMRFVDEFTG